MGGLRHNAVRRLVAFALLLMACGVELPVIAVGGRALAGPVCPVETDPPDPACVPRPVVGAVILVEGEGREYTVVTDEDGVFSIELPAGTYQLTPQPVEGLLGTASPLQVVVEGEPVDVGEILYDTGIR